MCEIKVERKPKQPNQELKIKLLPAKNSHTDQKYIIKINGKFIGVGSVGYSDYTINKTEAR